MKSFVVAAVLLGAIVPAGAVTLNVQDTFNAASNNSPLKDPDNSWVNSRGSPLSGTPGSSPGGGTTGSGGGGGSTGGGAGATGGGSTGGATGK